MRQSTSWSQCADSLARQEQGSRARRLAAEARRMHARLYDHAQKPNSAFARSQSAPHQRVRGDQLHRRGRPQSAGALGGADPGGRVKDLPGVRYPHRPRQPRYPGRQGPQARPIQVRRERTQGCLSSGKSPMPRRREVPARDLARSEVRQRRRRKFVNVLMTTRKKSVAEHIVYDASTRSSRRAARIRWKCSAWRMQNVSPWSK